jgi:hypothetical protein
MAFDIADLCLAPVTAGHHLDVEMSEELYILSDGYNVAAIVGRKLALGAADGRYGCDERVQMCGNLRASGLCELVKVDQEIFQSEVGTYLTQM